MIYTYTLQPIEVILETLFTILIGISGSPFLSIIMLAVLVRLLTKPLEKYANLAVNREAEIALVLAPQIDVIKLQSTGSLRHDAIKRLYARYAYHPIFSIRSLAGLGVQLPFFIAAYFMLSDFEQLAGVIVPILGDLGEPDSLLLGNIHLMPFVMTLVNILALITVPGFSRKNLIQGMSISVLFLILLYSSPLGLLIYWTTSNLFSLASNFTPVIKEKLGVTKRNIRLKDTVVGRGFEEYAYIFFITNLAILVPLLGVLGDQFIFFTAHSLPSNSIITLLLIIGFLPTIVLAVLRFFVKKMGFVTFFDGCIIFVFFWVFLIYTLNNLGYGLFPSLLEPYIIFFLALMISFWIVVFILRANLTKALSYFSLIIPLIILHFIYISPASTLFKQEREINSLKDITPINIPIFLLVFDEFSGLTLQNSKGGLDKLRYPGFAELAAKADYFPNALTVAWRTGAAVPSILSGNLPNQGKAGLVSSKNLFDFFRTQGVVHADSSVLPADFLYKKTTNQITLASDLITLYLRIVSHKDWIEEKFGVMPPEWKGFGVFFKEEESSDNVYQANPYISRFLDWLDGISEVGNKSQFNFLHSQFPHSYYDTSSLGRVHQNGKILEPRFGSEDFDAEQVHLNVSYHLYMEQTSYADKLLQTFIQDLKEKKLFDKSLIVVTADHGVSYSKNGANRRVPINEDSWKNLVSVPLFIKYPYQNTGVDSPSFVTILDITATIMSVLGENVSWKSVGQDLAAIKHYPQTRSVELVPGYEKYFKNINGLFQESRSRKEKLFGEGSPINTIAVNYTENTVYEDLANITLSALAVGADSKFHALWEGSQNPKEISYFGTVYDGRQRVNQITIAAVVDGNIQAVFESGSAFDQGGFFAFALPHTEIVPAEFNVTLYEISGEAPFIFRRIPTGSLLQDRFKQQFLQSSKNYDYNFMASIIHHNDLHSADASADGMRLLSRKSDPYVIFQPISKSKVSEPIFRIELESTRELNIDFYYQTLHRPEFVESQRLRYRIPEGSKSLYIRVPEEDFVGPFRIDIGNGGETDILIREIEVR
jgi:hypothetical protein